MTRPAADSRASLVGRDKETACLSDLVSPPYEGTRALLLLGEPGLGKTALLTEAAVQARSGGMWHLSATGRESERELAFSGLHQLLRPALRHIAGLPARQAAALRGAFALSGGASPPDALLTGIAVLTLLSLASEESPLLVTADDVQWMDHASIFALAFAARRLAAEHVVLLVSARGTMPPPDFERDFPRLLLEPLPVADAGRLLDSQPTPPRGRAREQVLSQAAGNPLALIELSKMLATDPGAGRHLATELLPLTSRLTAIMAARYTALPERAKAGLLLAAAADSGDVTAHAGGLTMDTLAHAEAAGLIRIDASGPHFTHPLARSAVYHSAPFAERAAAHLKVADAVRDRPDRHAWHLAAAALGPDEHVAALLEDSAGVAKRRGGAAASARAMERAAELSPDDGNKARRMLAAAQLAHAAGQADWVLELARNTLAVTSDQDLRFAARLEIGWSLLWSNRNAEALDTLLSVAADALLTHPTIAWDAVGVTAILVHQSGLPDVRAKVRAALSGLDAAGAQVPDTDDWPASNMEEARSWIRACTDPFDDRTETVSCVKRMAGRALSDPGKVGAAAWSLDEPELAVQVLRQALTKLRAPGFRGASGAVLSCLQWACADSGRWDEALAAAREAADIAAAYKMQAVAANSHLVTATIAAMRGEQEQVTPLLARVLADVDEAVYRGFAARVRHAAGLAALAEGRNVAAYAQLSREFAADGTPLHYQFSYYAIADYAAAAARAERRLEAANRVERALVMAGPAPGSRLEQLAARARGLLADPAQAEAHFTAGLADPAGETWPFERAQLKLDYGEWLRRQRRINDAKPLLGAALDTFTRLGAAPWTRRTDSELRACGVTAEAEPIRTNALDELTPQQREIAILAGHGLTNNEIADRLFLSPRTVASHLHRSYPKLGVAGRHQLHGLIDPAGTRKAGG
ncbi:helix-turn-helix transcriptional regulator [Trebonia kvetii]|uniref:Helix-turn-helix transcriptional regulator n=1 Tax=Trebonia kvetii TaxID=2480626 RepID=A0A6P2C0E1_9ACTN|nr:helix-turn-helix transcriptional regulator [Trebonia kvetii]TVZ04610.1 helix-turn-helix transcriptional regulator [Trebonia kvetii]